LIRYYLNPSNLWGAILNGIFRIEMFFRPKKKRELEQFIAWMEEELTKEIKRRDEEMYTQKN
jgi:hypothetical protein|tara:strand:- start:482 stop:667 length:186 start_codon:yes stop_codon:yes gene_type:complete